MKPIDSNTIKAIGYEGTTLSIQFHNGSVYSYSGVPEDVYADMLLTEHPGVYFNLNIKKYYRMKQVN